MAPSQQVIRRARLAAVWLVFVAAVLIPQIASAPLGPLFAFAQISDSQPSTATEQAMFEQVLDALVASGQPGALIPQPVDFVLIAGDLVDEGGILTEWTSFVETIDSRLTANDIPYLATPGNHDVRDGGIAFYEQFIADAGVWDADVDVIVGQNGPAVSLGWVGLRFIGFNNSNGDWNVISPEDLVEIDQLVMETSTLGENVFLLAHHPHDGQSLMPLASTLESPNVVGYMRGHSGSTQATGGLTGISNPNAWDLNSNSIKNDGAILYYEVFETEIRVHAIELDTNPAALPAAVSIPLVHGLQTLGPPVVPTSDFSATPLLGSAPLDVAFTDLSAGSPTAWLWDFGDGTTSSHWEPTHTYAAPGVYDVSLTVSNDLGTDSLVRSGLVTVLPPPPSVTYLPVADARVKNTSPTRNYGVDDRLRIRDGSDVFQSYLKFDVAGLGSSTILSARLRLFVTDGSPDGGTLYETGNSWSELGITWETAPGPGGAPLASAGAVEAGFWVEFDVSPVVAGDGLYAFVLTSSSSNSAYFSSREGLNPPELVVETAQPEAPVADFVGVPLDGRAPLAVTFADLSTGPATSWLWEFGDGLTATEQHPTHIYAEAGLYAVTLTVTNSLGSDSTTKTGYVAVEPPAPPTASFSLNPASGAVPLDVSFTDLSTGPPTAWFWDFGDGTTSTQRHPTHSYREVGIYDVSLEVSNSVGTDTFLWTGAVTVLPPPPVATFLPVADSRVNARSPTTNYGDDVALRARAVDDESHLMFDVIGLAASSVSSATLRLYVTDGSPVGGTLYETAGGWEEMEISWDTAPVPGGAPVASAGKVTTDTWIELDVTDAVVGEGVYAFVLTSSSKNSVYFSSREGANPPELVVESGAAVPPLADFLATPLSGETPLPVEFADLSTNRPTSWLWEFGDGNSSTQQNPTHTYMGAGVYDVSLTATNAAGSDTIVQTGLVTVTAANEPPTVTITAPADGSVIIEGTAVTFTATASDQDGSDLSEGIAWSSDKDGPLGTGASLTLTDLSKGRHQITATAIDGGGIDGAAAIGISIKKGRAGR